MGGDSHAGRHAEKPDKVLRQIKTGAGTDERGGDAALIGGAARVSKDGDWSESYMVNLFDWHLKEQETLPSLTGSAQWVFKDFSTPVRPDNPIPFMNQKGVVERDFTKKESYYVFQSYWATKPMIHIYGHTWPVRWGDNGEVKTVKVFSNCQEVELIVNGISLGNKKRYSQDFPAAGLRWDVIFQPGKNHIKAIGKAGGKIIIDEIDQEYQPGEWGKPASIHVEKIAMTNDIATVELKLKDEQGMRCLDAKDVVLFGLTGDGKLLDNFGTTTGSRKIQMYNGRAVIKVQLNNGKSMLSAGIAGLPTAFISL